MTGVIRTWSLLVTLLVLTATTDGLKRRFSDYMRIKRSNDSSQYTGDTIELPDEFDETENDTMTTEDNQVTTELVTTELVTTELVTTELVTTEPPEYLEEKKLVFESTKSLEIEDVLTDNMRHISVCHWLKLGEPSAGVTMLWKYRDPVYAGKSQIGFALASDGKPMVIVFNKSPTYDLPAAISEDEWHHICMKWRESDGLIEYFQDGELRASGTNSLLQDEMVIIGGKLSLGGANYKFELSQFNIWQSELSISDIQRIFNCDPNLQGDLFLWNEVAIVDDQQLIDIFDLIDETVVKVMCQGCHRYDVHFKKKRYAEAQAICGPNGHLAKLAAEDAYQFVLSNVRENDVADLVKGNGFWIGMTDIGVNEFVWHDGDPVSDDQVSRWAKRQPDNSVKRYDSQDCGQLWRKKDFEWDDDYCHKKKSYICEIEFCTA